nr:unnamed protein product [Callosobruchus analis]
MAKRITSREERQVLYGKSFSYNHIVNSKAIPGSHLKTKHSSVSSKKLKSCVLCDATFKRKTSLDDHVVKNHPNDIASLSNKVYECSECLYKTVAKNNYLRHVSVNHTEADLREKHTCPHCNVALRRKSSLNDHILGKHPDFIGSITKKIYECTECAWKTTSNSRYLKHTSAHHERGSSDKLVNCIHCNAAFKKKTQLDEHLLKKHPDSITSIARKVYECTECVFRTTVKSKFRTHTSTHGKTGPSCKSTKRINCIHCDSTFRKRSTLEEHILKRHPDFIPTITRQIYECVQCIYKTTFKNELVSHMLKHTVKVRSCSHCDASFRERRTLYDHVLKEHPNFMSSITSTIYRCAECHYKTVRKKKMNVHMSVHFKAEDSPFRCIHCNVTFASKIRLDEHIIRKHPNFSSSVTSKLHECTKCTFKTVIKSYLDKHLLKHPEIASTCVHCNATFKSKKSLDYHVVAKHPDFISSVTNKLHECTKCTFKTTSKCSFDKHLLKHPGLASICVHCNATFKSKTSLDDHVIRKHPDFISSIVSKLHECTKCTFKTTSKCSFDKHLLKHPGLASDFSRCDATFLGKLNLDQHIIIKHPDIISSIASKLHECTKCHFKTVRKRSLNRHLLEHPEKLCICSHCNATFKGKVSLDYHVVKKHPDFVSSITSKLHECTECPFKTVIKCYFDKHLLKHSDFKQSTCGHCNATFKSKKSLDDHVLRKHPGFFTAVTYKVRECKKCSFKTIIKRSFDRHLLNHHLKHSTCIHCNVTFTNKFTLDNHVVRKHPEFITTVARKIYECPKCTYKTTFKNTFKRHISSHSVHSCSCSHCDASFRDKRALDEHVIRKHPNFMSSVTGKLHECTKCTYKTVRKRSLDKHLLNHPEIASNFKPKICIHCNATFKGKMSLDDHVVRKHPDFSTTVTSKLHKCTKCAFKTVKKGFFDKHLLKHLGFASDFKHITCVHCNAAFKSKATLDDHVVRRHPDFSTTVTSKVHKCTKCTFKAVKKDCFDKHFLKHLGLVSDFKHITCVHCNATFTSKMSLDDHVVRKHPDFISSVTSKLYECTKCTFKTVKKICFSRHLLKHPGHVSDFNHITCVHCNATFESKMSLDGHVVRKHPDFISSVTSKLYECTKCTFKTVQKSCFSRHLLKHPGLASDFKHITCVHCNATFKSKMSLDDHVVRKHPDFISSVTSKLYECTKCTFKTVKKSFFSRHLLKHSGLVSDFKLITCVHCNATFKSKMALDGHVVRKHPDFISSITSKLYECTKCTTFKTVKKSCFSRHLLKHPGLASDFKHITCVHCNATFKSKIVLDHHVLRKHPDFISSVTSKLHECTECAYKTVIKSYFDKHLLKHSDFAQHMRG